MDETVRWTVRVSKETDIALRSFLAHQGFRKGDLSKFIEEAVRWRVLERTVSAVMARNADTPAESIESAIDEALAEIRAESLRSPA